MYPNGKGLLQRVYKIPYEYQIASWGGQGTALPEPTTLSLTLFEDSLKVGERIDSSLSSAGLANFDVDFYELKSTFPDLGQDYFAVKWVGSIRGPKTGNVKLNFYTDNGFIVQIGDTIYDKFWLYDWEKNQTVNYPFVVDSLYPIKIEYFEKYGGEAFKVIWSPFNL